MVAYIVVASHETSQTVGVVGACDKAFGVTIDDVARVPADQAADFLFAVNGAERRASVDHGRSAVEAEQPADVIGVLLTGHGAGGLATNQLAVATTVWGDIAHAGAGKSTQVVGIGAPEHGPPAWQSTKDVS